MTSDTLLPYVVPREPGRGKAVALAVLVHALLFAFLWIGINWVSQPPESLEVDTFTQAELDQNNTPEPPQPVPTPKVEDRAPVDNDAEIRTAQQKKKEAEDAARLAAEQKKAEEKKKADEARREKEQEDAEKKREDDLKKKEQAKKDQAEKKLLDQARQAEIDRIKKEAGNSTASAPARPGGGKGDSVWAGKVSAKIKSLISFNAGPSANPNATAEFDVKLLPDGSVASANLTKSSGIPAFDQAVERAIKAAAPYPPDKDGIVPKYFPSSHRLGDQQ